jgi:hypothetical protein
VCARVCACACACVCECLWTVVVVVVVGRGQNWQYNNNMECCKKMKIFDFGKGNRFRREIVLEKSRSATLLTRVQNNDRVQPADDGSSAQQVMQESLCTSPCAAAGKACTATHGTSTATTRRRANTGHRPHPCNRSRLSRRICAPNANHQFNPPPPPLTSRICVNMC